MIPKYARLLAPAAVDGGASATDTKFTGNPDFLDSFLNDPPESAATNPPPPPEKKEGTPDGSKTDPAAGTVPPPVASGTGGTDAAPPPAGGKTEPAKAEGDKGKAGDKAPDDEPDDKWPRSSSDWDKFRAKHKGREDKLKGEVASRETKIAELQTKLTELEQKSAQPPENAEAKAEIERRDALIKQLTDRIAVLDVTKDPRFEKYFTDRIAAQQKMAENIVGAELKDQWGKIMALPDGDYRRGQIEEFMGNLTPYQQSRLGGVLNSLDAVEQERQAEITKAGEHRQTLMDEQEKRRGTIQEQRAKVFKDTVAALQDPKQGNPLFQTREGQAEWNNAVAKRIESAKTLLLGEKTPMESIVKAACYASAFPELLASYQADMKEKGDAIAKLEAQVKALTAAQPGAGGSAQKAGGSAPERMVVKEGMNPFEVAEAFAEGLTEAANAQ